MYVPGPGFRASSCGLTAPTTTFVRCFRVTLQYLNYIYFAWSFSIICIEHIIAVSVDMISTQYREISKKYSTEEHVLTFILQLAAQEHQDLI